MRQPKDTLGLRLLALHRVRNAGGNIGTGILDSGAQRSVLAVSVHNFAGFAALE